MIGTASSSGGMQDVDFRNAMLASLRLLAGLTVVVAGLFWWRAGWPSAALVLIGAVISAASLWGWLRLMTAVNEQMDAGGRPRPMGRLLVGFFARLGLTVAALYVSLRYLHGTAFALAAGLGLGVVSLTIEALRMLQRRPV